MTYVATLMQRAVRRFVANRNFVLKKWAAITLQAAYRGMVDRRRAAAIRASLELQQRLNEEHWATIVRLREETRDMVQQYYVLKAKDEMLAGRIVTKWARPHALRLQRLRAAHSSAGVAMPRRTAHSGSLHKWLSRPVLRHCLAVRKLKPAVVYKPNGRWALGQPISEALCSGWLRLRNFSKPKHLHSRSPICASWPSSSTPKYLPRRRLEYHDNIAEKRVAKKGPSAILAKMFEEYRWTLPKQRRWIANLVALRGQR